MVARVKATSATGLVGGDFMYATSPRMAVGAEAYYSVEERSAGASLGGRYAWRGLSHSGARPFQPDAVRRVATLTVSLMGRVEGSATVEVTPDVTVSGMVDVSSLSGKTEWAVGVAWTPVGPKQRTLRARTAVGVADIREARGDVVAERDLRVALNRRALTVAGAWGLGGGVRGAVSVAVPVARGEGGVGLRGSTVGVALTVDPFDE